MIKIRSILITKSHNPHYLNRYIKLIQEWSKQSFRGYQEDHHICPKAKDMFPELESFADHPWNKISLTPRQHFIAHMLLYKAFKGSQTFAFNMMLVHSPDHGNNRHCKINSRIYASLKEDLSNQLSQVNKGRIWINNGTDCTSIYPSKLPEYKIQGWTKGRIFSQDHKDNLSKGVKSSWSGRNVAKEARFSQYEIRKVAGSKHKIQINGIIYKSKSEAGRLLGLDVRDILRFIT